MPEQLEVEIALRDSISSGLRQVGREIDKITRAMKEGGDAGGDAFSAFGKGAGEVKKVVDKTRESVGGLSGFMIGMSRTLMGATGVAAGFIAVGTALEGLATKRVQLRMLSTDLGFTEEKISVMRRTLEKLGLGAAEQSKLITSLGQSLKEVQRQGAYSPLIQQLQAMNEGDFARKLLKTIQKDGDFDKAQEDLLRRSAEIIKEYGATSKQALEIARVSGWPPSVLQGWHEGIKDVNAAHELSYQMSKDYKDETARLWREAEDYGNTGLNVLVKTLLAVHDAMKQFDLISLNPMAPLFYKKPEEGGTGPKEPKKMSTLGFDDSGGLPSNAGIAAYVEQGLREEDKKTNRLLGEIANTLKGFESNLQGGGNRGAQTSSAGLGSGLDLGGVARGAPASVGGGSPMGSEPMGMPRAMTGIPSLSRYATPPGAMTGTGLSQSAHAPIQTQQPMPTSGSLADVRSQHATELKDPAVRDMLMAYTHAEVGGGGPQAQQAFMETVLNRASSRGQTIKQALSSSFYPKVTHQRGARGPTDAQREQLGPMIDSVMGGSNVSNFATGNASGNVGFAGGPQTFKSGGERYGIERADLEWARRQRAAMEGTVVAGGGGDGYAFRANRASSVEGGLAEIQTESGVRAKVSAAAAPHLQGFIDDLVAAGAPITSIGGYNVRRIRGSNRMSQHSYGNAIDVNQSARNVVSPALAKWVRENVDKLGEIERRHGIVSGRNWKSPDLGHFEWGGEDERKKIQTADRATVDGSLKAGPVPQSHKGNVKAQVDFGNLSDVTKKSGDDLGKFKLLKINTEPQGAKNLEGMLTPGDLSYTTFVP